MEVSQVKKPRSISAYDDASNQQIIDTATPELLVLKLLEKGCVLLSSSIQSLEKNEYEPFQQSSLHALQIVLSLRFVLDTANGGRLAQDFYDTYTAIAASLLRAKNERNEEALRKIYLALDELRGAWRTLSARNE